MANIANTLTATEAACVTGVPLKQVHRIIDAGLLFDGVQVRTGARVISGRALVGLRLAHLTADTLTLDARRRIIRRVLDEPKTATFQEDAVTVAVAPVADDIRDGLESLDHAKAVVSIDPAVMSGAPCFVGTRIAVHDLAEMVANGDTVDAVAAAYPSVSPDQIQLAIVYAAAYPRRGRPSAKPAWRNSPTLRSKTLRLGDLPQTA